MFSQPPLNLSLNMPITIISSDEQSFQVERDVLKQSGTIETLIVNMNLEDTENDTAPMPIPLPNVNGQVLQKVLEWCEKHKEDPVREAEEEDSNTEVVIPDWDQTFLGSLEKTPLLEILIAANYLDIKALLTYACKAVANMLKGKQIEQIRTEWSLKNEFTPEEEAAIKKENEWCE